MSENVKPLDSNPLLRAAMKTPEEESAQAVETVQKIETLAELHEQLQELRQKTVLVAKRKDIDYIERFDEMIEAILKTIADNRDILSESVVKILRQGDIKRFKELMVALSLAVDKREALLGFDETRDTKKRKLKLQVIWKGSDGSSGGVKVET